jgi:hypothetical protein
MKRVFLILSPLLPVIYILSIAGLIIFDANDSQTFAVFGCYIILSLTLSVLGCIFTKDIPQLKVARSHLWSTISNLTLFICEAVYWIITLIQIRKEEEIGAMGGGLALLILILICLPHWISYLLTRITGAVNCTRILQGKSNRLDYFLHTIMHLFPVTDLISAILVLRQVKKVEN